MKKDNGPSLKSPEVSKVTKVIRLLTAWALIVPSVALGWAVLPAQDDIWVAVLVTFGPTIPGWYLSGLIADWYQAYLNYQGLGRFLAISLLKNPVFREEFVRMWTMYVTDEESLLEIEEVAVVKPHDEEEE